MIKRRHVIISFNILLFIYVLVVNSFIYFNGSAEDVQSDAFRARADRNRAAIIACLYKGRETNTSLVEYLNKIRFPNDAERHFEEIKNASKIFYEKDPHYYASYDGK